MSNATSHKVSSTKKATAARLRARGKKGVMMKNKKSTAKSAKTGEFVNGQAKKSTTKKATTSFKIDKSPAARAMSKAFAMTQKRIHGDS